MQLSNLLIADTNRRFREQLSLWLKKRGISSAQAPNIEECRRLFREHQFDIVLLNSNITNDNLLENMKEFLAMPGKPEVIVLSGHPDPTEAENVIKSGAWDYLEQSESVTKVGQPILSIARSRNQQKQLQKAEIAFEKFKEEGITGISGAILKCMDLVERAAQSDAFVLIAGETGTGKELFATAIHTFSPRGNRNFVIVDCASLPENLVESILFGHEKGAFTGADRQRTGLIKEADGGTLFLDEIGELSLAMQKSFLRVLQEKRFRPVGGKQEIFSNFRLISATNKNLDEMALEKTFRSDLLFRIRALTIDLPPLRERQEDINLLAQFFLSRLCKNYGIREKPISPDFLAALNRYHWPGNVRELYHAMERALTAGMDHLALYAKHLPDHIRAEITKNSLLAGKEEDLLPLRIQLAGSTDPQSDTFPKLEDYRDRILNKAESDYLVKVAGLADGDVTMACKLSGLSRSRLYALFKKHELRIKN